MKRIYIGDQGLVGERVRRRAIKGVPIRRNESGEAEILVLSTRHGVKFAGGGIEEGESEQDALKREFREELGAVVNCVGGCLVRVIESRVDAFAEQFVFEMTSDYVRCDLLHMDLLPAREEYEVDLEMEPVWLQVKDAVAISSEAANCAGAPSWVHRDLMVLQYLEGLDEVSW